MNSPTLSICVPTYRRKEELLRVLNDLLNGEWQDFEIIVGDDASGDGTIEAVQAISDPRVRLLAQPHNIGIYANWNAMIAEARGEYVAIYHDHDAYSPTIASRTMALFAKYPELVMAHTAVVMVDETFSPIEIDIRDLPERMTGQEFRERLADSAHSPVMAATTIVRRAAYEKAGPFDDSRYGLGCDKAMWFRLAAFGDIGYLSDPQALIRARTRSDGTATFRWSNAAGLWRMQLDQLKALGRSTEAAYKRIQNSYNSLMIRTAVLGTEEERRQGVEIANEYAFVIPSLYRIITRFPGAKWVAKHVLLPYYYARLARQEQAKRIAARTEFQNHPDRFTHLVRLRRTL